MTMNPETKRKFDRMVNWALAISLLTSFMSVVMVSSYRADNAALRAELQPCSAEGATPAVVLGAVSPGRD